LPRLNSRKKWHDHLREPRELKLISDIVFDHATNLNMSSDTGRAIPFTISQVMCGSGLPDIEAQLAGSKEQEDVNLYSPYYSPLEAQKQLDTVLQVWQPVELYARSWFASWKGT
jgi:hypothetical protein